MPEVDTRKVGLRHCHDGSDIRFDYAADLAALRERRAQAARPRWRRVCEAVIRGIVRLMDWLAEEER